MASFNISIEGGASFSCPDDTYILDADVERGHDAEDPEGLVAGSAHRRQGSRISNLFPYMLGGGAGEGTCARSTPRSVGSDARVSGIIPRMRTVLTKQ